MAETKSIDDLYSEVIKLRSEITELKNAFIELRMSIIEDPVNSAQFDEVGFDNEPGFENDEGVPCIDAKAFERLIDEGKVDFIYAPLLDIRGRWRVCKKYELLYCGEPQILWKTLDGETFDGDNVLTFAYCSEAHDYAEKLNTHRKEEQKQQDC